jgi:UDP-perosamine 4-acetyltransferase
LIDGGAAKRHDFDKEVNTMQETLILGSGGHAKVIIEILRESGVYAPVGCIAPLGAGESSILGVPVVGDDDQLPELRQRGITYAFVALGDNRLRARLLRLVAQLGFEVASAVSPSATISPSARLGNGIAIMPGAHVGPDAIVADGVIVNSHASVDHDCVLHSCCHIGPGSTLAGGVTIGSEAFVGTGASLIPGITVGIGSLVGAGSVVVRDIPPQMLAFGTPARCQRSLDIETDRRASKAAAPHGHSGDEAAASALRLVS